METFIQFISLTLEIFGVLMALMLPFVILEKIDKWKPKNLTIIPEFHLNSLKFYEVAAFVDSQISTADVSAIAAYYILNPNKPSDKTEEVIYKDYATKKYIEQILSLSGYNPDYDREKPEVVHFKDFLRDLANGSFRPNRSRGAVGLVLDISSTTLANLDLKRLSYLIYKKLIKDGFYRYNPVAIERTFTYIGLGMLAFIFINMYLPWYRYNLTPYVVVFLSIFMIVYIISFAYYFAQKLNKINKIRRDILGFKMFLNTTEFYTVQKDYNKFREYIPYFILFGIHTKYLTSMLAYCLGELEDRANSTKSER